MSLVRYPPGGLMRTLQDDLDRLFEQRVANWTPPVDIREEESRDATNRDERNGYRRVERISGRFFRRFTLPDTANAEDIKAHSTHGALEVIIPKHDRVMPRRISADVN